MSENKSVIFAGFPTKPWSATKVPEIATYNFLIEQLDINARILIVSDVAATKGEVPSVYMKALQYLQYRADQRIWFVDLAVNPQIPVAVSCCELFGTTYDTNRPRITSDAHIDQGPLLQIESNMRDKKFDLVVGICGAPTILSHMDWFFNAGKTTIVIQERPVRTVARYSINVSPSALAKFLMQQAESSTYKNFVARKLVLAASPTPATAISKAVANVESVKREFAWAGKGLDELKDAIAANERARQALASASAIIKTAVCNANAEEAASTESPSQNSAIFKDYFPGPVDTSGRDVAAQMTIDELLQLLSAGDADRTILVVSDVTGGSLAIPSIYSHALQQLHRLHASIYFLDLACNADVARAVPCCELFGTTYDPNRPAVDRNESCIYISPLVEVESHMVDDSFTMVIGVCDGVSAYMNWCLACAQQQAILIQQNPEPSFAEFAVRLSPLQLAATLVARYNSPFIERPLTFVPRRQYPTPLCAPAKLNPAYRFLQQEGTVRQSESGNDCVLRAVEQAIATIKEAQLI